MKKVTKYVATALLGAGLLAGCSGSGGQASSTGKTITGKVADGYLANAVVFLDKNGNYQLDAGEPNTTTDAAGAFTLTIDPADVGKYPIVALAVKDQTVDQDTPGTKLGNTYVLSMHALTVTSSASGTVTGTVSNFISPYSTLIRETLEANPTMTVAEAVTQVRNQLNMPSDVNIQRDYVFGSMSGAHKPEFRKMHDVAREMAGLMGGQSLLVMNGNGLAIGRYRQMMGQIGNNLPQIMDGADLEALRARLTADMERMPTTAPFRNISSLFSNYTGQKSFWNMSGGKMHPKMHRM